jgi:ubiquinone/menaquinone biosynthesis C-methylase UbiE
MDQHTRDVEAQFTRQARAYAETNQAKDEKAMAGLARLAAPEKTDRVLDVACGPGVLTRVLARQSLQAVGCDVTDALLDIAKQGAAAAGVPNVSFSRGSAMALPFETDSFDLACCRAAFHHFETPAAVLAEMVRVVRPGGRLMIADILASENDRAARAHNNLERLCDPTHTHALARSEFERLFADRDLTVERCIEAAMHYEVEAWMDHGGPDPAVRDRIRSLFRQDIEVNTMDLNCRLEGEQMYFTHRTAVFMLSLNPAESG